MTNELNLDNWFEICAIEDITANTGVSVKIADKQIAVFRLGDANKVYALSNQDPFSQAFVMSRGIVGDVQYEPVVASPIYKQHFSLATGRCLEDSSKKLAVFPIKVVAGKVLLSPKEKKTYAPTKTHSDQKHKLVLIGNGLAGMRCLEDLLDMAPDKYQITVIGEEPWGNYNRILLSPVLSGEKTVADIMLHTKEWYAERNIRFLAGNPAIRIDRPRKKVQCKNGEIIDYDRLIVATGSLPFIPPIEGSNLNGVMSFRDIYDVEKMLSYAKEKKHAVVIGGGLLGLEAAYGLKQQGMEVSVLHLLDKIMNRQLDAKASDMLKDAIEKKGIRVITQADTQALLGENGQVQQVQLKDGRIIAADLVVFAIGIRPNSALAKSAQLNCNRGVLVNDTMQTSDPSIYAVGECIEHRGEVFGLVEPLWGQAFICASHLAEHGSLTFKAPTVPTKLKVSGCDVFSAGEFDPKEDFEDILLNDEKRQIYKRIIVKNDRVIGAVLFGDTEDGDWYGELISNKTKIGTMRDKLLFGREFALKKLG